MFKKSGINLLAFAFAIVASISAFAVSSHEKQSQPGFADTFWQITNPSQPLQGSSYSSISLSTYNAISCTGSAQVCKLRSSSATLPATMTDANGDQIPDVTGTVLAVPTKN